MPGRKVSLVDGEFYHVYTKSIAGFKIFNSGHDFGRMIGAMKYYQSEKYQLSYSKYLELCRNGSVIFNKSGGKALDLVEIIAYCLMETHLHFLLRQLRANGISDFMKLLLNSYSRYFNTKHKRKGPLWEGRFGSVRVSDNDHLLQLTRYIHLNPVTAGLVPLPENWKYSSYGEYISPSDKKGICTVAPYLDINKESYMTFVNDHIGHHQELAKIKYLLPETPTLS